MMADPLALASPGAAPALACGAAVLATTALAFVVLRVERRNAARFTEARRRLHIAMIVSVTLAIVVLAARVTLTPYRVKLTIKGDSLFVDDGWTRRAIEFTGLLRGSPENAGIAQDSLHRTMWRLEGFDVIGYRGGWYRLGDDSRALVALTRRDRPYYLQAIGNGPSLLVSPADAKTFWNFVLDASIRRMPPDSNSGRNYTIPDSILRRAKAFEDALAHPADSASVPRLLWELGSFDLRSLNGMPQGSKGSDYLKQRPDQFFANEVDADYIYTGYHFRELLRRFPKDSLAEHAAYAITQLELGGECEGYVPCYVYRAGPLVTFLRQFPESPMAWRAVRDANAMFASYLEEDVKDSAQAAELVDSAKVRPMIAAYDSTASTLAPPLRALAYRTLAPIWTRWQNQERSRVMVSELLGPLAAFTDTAAVRRENRAVTGAPH